MEAINNRLEVTTIISSKKEKFFTKRLETGLWYYVEIFQKQSKIDNEKVRIKIDKQIHIINSCNFSGCFKSKSIELRKLFLDH